MNEEECRAGARDARRRDRLRRPQPSQEELREQIEEQLRKVRVQDLLLESVVSVINLSARRIAKEDERDLEQARVGIEAVRAVVGPAGRGAGKAGARRTLGGPDAVRETRREGPLSLGAGPGAAGRWRGAAAEEPASGAPSRLWTPPGSTPPR